MGEHDARVTWNKFILSLKGTVEAWEEHRTAMVFGGYKIADAEYRNLTLDFWRSPFNKMIDRFLGFFYGQELGDLLVEVPEEKPKKKGEAKDG